MFSPKALENSQFTTIVEQLITGEKAPVSNPKNRHHTYLTSNSNKKTRLSDISDRTLNSPSIFKQSPIWKNSNEKSIMTSKMHEQIQKDIKHIDL